MDAELGLKSVDTIFKLLPMLKSLTGERRREYYEKVLVPLYTAFDDVHEFYIGLFHDTRNAISEAYSRSTSVFGVVNKPELEARIGGIKADFSEKRRIDEHLRDALRQEAQQFIKDIRWKEERRFLVLLCLYFLRAGHSAPDDKYLDYVAEEIERQGGVTFLDTPSMRLYVDLDQAADKEALFQVLDEARNSMNQRYVNVRLALKRVQGALVLHT